MRIKKYLHIMLHILLLSCATNTAYAQGWDSLEKVQQQLMQQGILRGQFIQTKNLALFSNPLVSKGNFTLAKGKGLIWDQTQPFPVTLTLTHNKLIQSFSNAPAQIMTADQNPMAFYFSAVFLSLFQGDSDTLKKEFDLFFTPGDSQWRLVLTPKNTPLNKVFARIEVDGNSYINHISLIEVQKDSTDIEFLQQTNTPHALTESEDAQFNQ